ncbi:MAG TPA: MHYT domain-containing protein, partial [Burkholderiales bacterium]|nr:MHYT domain-containing protein [Burkholderiales bacterium]
VGTYNSLLVVLSVAVAIVASYVALDLASRVVASHAGIGARLWLAGGAVSMGTGIWSMHFIGMLAFRLPIPMSYDVPTTLHSLLIAVLASGFALYLVSRGHLTLRRLVGGGVLMGIGIFSMHYTGMAAMQLAPPIRYQPLLLALSVLIAIVASMIALWSAFELRFETILTAFWKKAGSALVMGIAISGMHYTGMAAATFAPDSVCIVNPQDIHSTWLAGTVGGFSLFFLAATLLISAFDAYLADVFAKHAENLNRLNAELETRVAERTVELNRTNQFLMEQIAERKAMDERIRESEARLQAFINNSPSAIFIKDLAGRYVFVNKQFTHLFGLDLERILFHTDTEIFPPDEAVQFQANDARALESRAAIEVEEVAHYTKGQHTSIVCKFPLFDSSGRVTALGGIVTDITERKRAEQELLTSRALLNEAQKLSHLGSWQWELANGRVIWSDELYRIMGVDPQSYRLSFEGTIGSAHPDDRADVERAIRTALDSGETFTLEHRILRPDGVVRHLRSSGECVKDAAGRPEKMLVSVLDITE